MENQVLYYANLVFYLKSRVLFQMAIEIERKFLLKDDSWQLETAMVVIMRQGYIHNTGDGVVRVRVAGSTAFLTIKGRTSNYSRLEYEYPVPLAHAHEMLDSLCPKPLVEKERFFIDHRGDEWCVDKFTGANLGLVVAEIELRTENQQFERPSWLGKEVTGIPRYYNSSLVSLPYLKWKGHGF